MLVSCILPPPSLLQHAGGRRSIGGGAGILEIIGAKLPRTQASNQGFVYGKHFKFTFYPIRTI